MPCMGTLPRFLESASLALAVTGDEGEAGENIQVNGAYVPREGTDDGFVKSATPCHGRWLVRAAVER